LHRWRIPDAQVDAAVAAVASVVPLPGQPHGLAEPLAPPRCPALLFPLLLLLPASRSVARRRCFRSTLDMCMQGLTGAMHAFYVYIFIYYDVIHTRRRRRLRQRETHMHDCTYAHDGMRARARAHAHTRRTATHNQMSHPPHNTHEHTRTHTHRATTVDTLPGPGNRASVASSLSRPRSPLSLSNPCVPKKIIHTHTHVQSLPHIHNTHAHAHTHTLVLSLYHTPAGASARQQRHQR
jgi:hypothetical protein